jgi:thiamine pyrophosphate-dependent acetolactate synthase large subunit-like protein
MIRKVTSFQWRLLHEAFGADGVRVENLEAFKAAVVEAKTASRNGTPYIINAIIGKTDFRKGSISV